MSEQLPHPSDLLPELIGCTTELMPAPDGSSGARVQMQGAHYQQAPVIVGNQKRNCFTGSEFEYAKYTFNICVEHTCKVERIIHRYPAKRVGTQPILETVLFVSLLDQPRKYDAIIIPRFASHHQYFGYDYVLTNEGRTVRRGQVLQKGTVLADTPGNIDDEWCIGINANAILASHPQVIEDACLISQELADNMMSYGYKTEVLSFGKSDYPLFLYGTEENPRIHPEVGEKVRADGILMAKRQHDELLCAVEMSTKSLMEPCGHFDHCINVDPTAEVVDIKVYRDDAPRGKLNTPLGMQDLCNQYADSLSYFYDQVRDFYAEIKKDKRVHIMLTPVAGQLVKDAIADCPDRFVSGVGPRKKQFGYDRLDDYRIEITVKFPIILDISGKITDTFGGKGVVGRVVPTEEMPIDEFGNRVHIIMSDNAMMRRTNWNRGYEHILNAARRDVQNETNRIAATGDFERAWEYMMGFVNCVSPKWHDVIDSTHSTVIKRQEFLESLTWDTLRMWIPTDNPLGMLEVESNIKAHYPPLESTLTITMPDGSKTQTVEKFIVGEIYIIRLDKTGRDFSSLSAGRYQHFGTIAKQHSRDRSLRPVREHPIKVMGEAESRHLNAFVGGDLTAEIHDRSNNPIVAGEVIKSILMTDTPMNIPEAVDRTRFPLGNNRTMAILNHVNECDGVAFTKGEDE